MVFLSNLQCHGACNGQTDEDELEDKTRAQAERCPAVHVLNFALPSARLTGPLPPLTIRKAALLFLPPVDIDTASDLIEECSYLLVTRLTNGFNMRRRLSGRYRNSGWGLRALRVSCWITRDGPKFTFYDAVHSPRGIYRTSAVLFPTMPTASPSLP